MLRRITMIGLCMILMIQSVPVVSLALSEENDIHGESIKSDSEIKAMTNMDVMKELVKYFGVDYFVFDANGVVVENSIEEKIQSMVTHPNELITNYEMVDLMSELVDVQERKRFQIEQNGLNSPINLSSNLITFFSLGYLHDEMNFTPSNYTSVENMDKVLENMLGYVVEDQNDLKSIPSDVDRVTIIKSGVVVENMTIDADVLVTPKAKAGVIFKNSTINGSLELAGGSETSPVIIDGTTIESVVIAKSSFKPFVNISDGSNIKNVRTKMESRLVCENSSTIESLETIADTYITLGEDVQIEELITKAKTVLNSEESSRISTLKVNAETEMTGVNVVQNYEKKSSDIKIYDNTKNLATVPSKRNSLDNGSKSSRKSKGSSSSNNDSNNDNTGPKEPEFVRGPVSQVKWIEVSHDKIKVIFENTNGTIDKTTAEDTRNYYINGIGNPRQAKLSNFEVELDISNLNNYMKFSKNYTLEVYNVGNSNNVLVKEHKSDFIYTRTELDITPPFALSVNNLNQGILLVKFNESICINNGSKINIKDSDGSVDSISAINRVGVSDEYAVFNVSHLEGQSETYSIIGFEGITDTGGLKASDSGDLLKFNTQEDYDIEGNRLKYRNAIQSYDNIVEIEYDHEVFLKSNSYIYRDEEDNVYEFELSGLGNTVKLTYDISKGSKLDAGKTFTFDLSTHVEDIISRPVKSEEIHIEWEIIDTVKPSIVKVEAINQCEVLVTYDEPIYALGTYIIADEYDNEFSDYLIKAGMKSEEVIIRVSKETPFSKEKKYYIKQKDLAKDYNYNCAVDSGTIDFEGTTEECVYETIDGIQILNAQEIKIVDGDNLPTGEYIVISGSAITGDQIISFDVTSNDVENIQSNNPVKIARNHNEIIIGFISPDMFIIDQKYTITGDVDQPNWYADFKSSFEGIGELTYLE